MEPNNSYPSYSAHNDDVKEPTPPVTPTNEPTTPQITPSPYVPAPTATSRNSWLIARAYLPEFFIMLIALASVLSATSSLITTAVDRISPNNSSAMDVWGALSSYTLLISLASLIVFLPVFVILYFRTHNSEQQAPEVITHRWRKGFLGGFIVFEALGIIWSLISLVYTLLGQFIKVDVPFVGSLSSSTPIWKSIVTTLVSVALTSFVIWVVSRQYARVGKGN